MTDGSMRRGRLSWKHVTASRRDFKLRLKTRSWWVGCLRYLPANTGHSPNAVSMLAHRLRRCPNIETALSESPMFARDLLFWPCAHCVPLGIKWCIYDFVKWRIHPFITKGKKSAFAGWKVAQLSVQQAITEPKRIIRKRVCLWFKDFAIHDAWVI